jgi:NDP-sugar pyrophosphorylase family protein
VTNKISGEKMEAEYRSLSSEEIKQLAIQGCYSSSWNNVLVAQNFKPDRIRGVSFSGQVKLGTYEKHMSFPSGVKRLTGISNATIHNCTIGNEVYINNVTNHIANYIIEDNVIIENLDRLVVHGKSCFGNGTEVVVVNEGGGREVPIYDQLSAHTAYIIVFYRHRAEVIAKLRQMISDYTSKIVSSVGLVGKGARIFNCRIIKNVRIGPSAIIEGSNRLENGSINSTAADHTHIGPGVVADDFIISSGAKIGDSVIVKKCFIGQGAILDKQYSAENSLFFANCECLRGEACSVFAGPFTVTHHKPTMLIAGLFSFANAGSGTNQSNHMYKIGPVHQGVVERGCKTSSDSYILWPARIGAFSVIDGRHYGRADTGAFPFSYVVEQNGRTVLSPGTALRRCGLTRDREKWATRERRKDPEKLDYYHLDILSPYTVQKALKGLDILNDHKAEKDPKADCYDCPGVVILNSGIKTGIKLYEELVTKFLGDCFVERLESGKFEKKDELHKLLAPKATSASIGEWVDLGGLLAPKLVVRRILDDIEHGAIYTLDRLQRDYRLVHANKPVYQWAWAAQLLQHRLGKTLDKITTTDIIFIIRQWIEAVERFARLQLADVQREFIDAIRYGYGLDGDEKTKNADFDAVRGTFDQNPLVKQIQESVEKNNTRAKRLITQLQKLD